MMAIEDRIQQFKKKAQQKEHQKLLKENREKESKEKINHRRKYIVGEIVLECFPSILELTPRGTEEENRIEFAGFRSLMEAFAELIDQSKKFDHELSELSFKDFDR